MPGFNLFIEKLKRELKKDLPGETAWVGMMPSGRITPLQNSRYEKAAVLLLLYPENETVKLVLIKRSEYVGHHSGQVSFPGGRAEGYDNSLKETALRETEEELGADSAAITVIGQLTPLIIPVSRYEIFPFVGYTQKNPSFSPNPTEVSKLIVANIDMLTDPRVRKVKKMCVMGEEMEVPFYEIEKYQVWGATAMILSEFVAIIKNKQMPGL